MAILTKKSKAMLGALAVLGISGVSTAMTTPIQAHAEDKKTTTTTGKTTTSNDTGLSGSSVEVNQDGSVKYGGDLANGSKGDSWTQLIKKYRFFIAGISGIGAVSMILFFIMNFMKLGANSSNPQERSKATIGLVFSGIAAAGLGAVTFIVGLFFNALGD